MESLSFESTIESPAKPHQDKVPTINNKSLFLVQIIPDNKTQEQNLQNLENNEIKEKLCTNTLNFDDVLELVFPKPNTKNPNKKKLVGNKTKRTSK